MPNPDEKLSLDKISDLFNEMKQDLRKDLKNDINESIGELEKIMSRRISRLEDRAYDRNTSDDLTQRRGLIADNNAFSGTNRWVGDNFRVR